jgi:hypothetical protein
VCAAAFFFAGVHPVFAQGRQSKGQTQQSGAPPALQAPTSTEATHSTVEVDSSPQLFATMCALWASGYSEVASTGGMPPEWAAVAEKMATMQGPATDAVRKYYREHEHSDREETLSRYVSFAMAIGPAPDFQYTMRRDDLPPDVLVMEDFNEVLAKFYKEARIDSLWMEMEPKYEPDIERLQEPVSHLVVQTTGYLREILRSSSTRTFSVYVEPLVGRSRNFRAYGDHYVIVVNGGEEIPVSQIRHALLYFVLDPLPQRYFAQIAVDRPLLNIAARAPRFPREYVDDFIGFYTECFVKAVEIRLDRMKPDQQAHAIDAAEADGYVLVRPLVAELVKFEQDDPAMTYYFPDMIKDIDVAAETQRLQTVKFAPGVPQPKEDPTAVAEAQKERMLEQAERLLTKPDPPGAEAAFKQVLAKWPGTPRAVYGLAVCALMEGRAGDAIDGFNSLTKPADNGAASTGSSGLPTTDPTILAWSHVSLGRLYDTHYDMYGDAESRDLAITEYKAALAVEGAPEAARQAAQLGVQKPYEPPSHGGDRPAGPGQQ